MIEVKQMNETDHLVYKKMVCGKILQAEITTEDGLTSVLTKFGYEPNSPITFTMLREE